MLRITRWNDEASRTGFRLEGRLTTRELPLLDESLSSANGVPLALDLSQLQWADRDGVARLRALVTAGAHVASCSPFLAHLMSEES